MSETSVLWEETVEPGAAWSHVLKRGTSLLITDMEGGANVGAIFYNFECPAERFNLPDTLKAQHVARLTKGCVLYSDMGRILCSITEDTVGWHDPLGGCSNAQSVACKYGSAPYQQYRNHFHRNGRDSFLVEIEKWGLGPRDLSAVEHVAAPRKPLPGNVDGDTQRFGGHVPLLCDHRAGEPLERARSVVGVVAS